MTHERDIDPDRIGTRTVDKHRHAMPSQRGGQRRYDEDAVDESYERAVRDTNALMKRKSLPGFSRLYRRAGT